MKPPVEAQALIRGDLIVSLDHALRGLAMLLRVCDLEGAHREFSFFVAYNLA
jgi:hypothetical protein